MNETTSQRESGLPVYSSLSCVPPHSRASSCLQGAEAPLTKAIVFSSLWQHARLIAQQLLEHGVRFAEFRSNMTPAEKADSLRLFKVCLCNTHVHHRFAQQTRASGYMHAESARLVGAKQVQADLEQQIHQSTGAHLA